jgi:hypothetical protein
LCCGREAFHYLHEDELNAAWVAWNESGEVIKNELKNITLFNTAKPAGLSIEWLHGQDICPDELYYNSVPAADTGF